jgi:hypothetical protein
MLAELCGVNEMGVEPETVILIILIRGCQFHDNVKKQEIVDFKRSLRIKGLLYAPN